MGFDYEMYVQNMGYKSLDEFIKKIVMPASLGAMVIFILLLFFVKINPAFHFLILILMLIMIFALPILAYEKKKVKIDEKIHYFITYAGTISTLGIELTALFKKITEQNTFGEIAKIFEKILYLARKWNFGYSKTLHTVSKYVPSEIFGDFVDRLAISIDFGEDIKVFLENEQDAVMTDYATKYKENLEKIRGLQEIMMSVTMAISFFLSISLMMPIIMGIPAEGVLQKGFMFLTVVDLLILVIVKFFIPSDYLCHSLKRKSPERIEVLKAARIFFPLSATIFLVMSALGFFSLIVNFAIAITPLMYVGFKAQNEDNMIFERDKIFPQFIRTLGSATEVKKGDLTEAMFSLLVHDFGILNGPIESFYRRLRLGNDKFKCWYFFEADSGSNLIQNFSQIFAESIFLGGNGDYIGELVSKNFQRLNSLRLLRLQLVGGLRGVLYGALIGFVITSSISLGITNMLSEMFTGAMEVSEEDQETANMMSAILPMSEETLSQEESEVYIALMIIIHSLISAMILKEGDGGSFLGFLFDFIMMVWIGALLMVVIPIGMEILIPSPEQAAQVGMEIFRTLLI